MALNPVDVPTEHQEQTRLIRELATHHPLLLVISQTTGARTARSTARHLKAEGMLAGVPDLFFPDLNLWIEMKRKQEGSVSPEQRAMIARLNAIPDHQAIVCKGCDAALIELEKLIKERGLKTHDFAI